MAHAYTPGLRVSDFTLLVKERRLPLLGEVLVKVGDRVNHDQVIARTNLPGDVQSLNVAHRLSIEASDLPHYMLKKEGDTIEKGEVIAESRSFFGVFKTRCESPITGAIETMSSVTGQVLLREPPIPVEVKAYVDGVVTEVHPQEGASIETWGSFIQGIFGVGGETNGELRVVVDEPGDNLTPDRVPSDAEGQILVTGSRITMDGIDAAREAGARGIIGGGFDDKDLKTLLGIELGVAITGHEEIGITLVLTEGFGEIAMADRTFRLLKENEGRLDSEARRGEAGRGGKGRDIARAQGGLARARHPRAELREPGARHRPAPGARSHGVRDEGPCTQGEARLGRGVPPPPGECRDDRVLT